ncbi:hypothetical protein MKK88_02520 [Methylobacterium sp. E-005]|uniref:hypothetical protein n=1 Tax=Methylobacterium sp. E-005 TaxID=2836549 RepID=UPI001FB94387|nr:hypothetical protein [Methylobacterium sp. E-005]MCJ2084868.1 hypothetical protein [Methylobacterium sp. E-005]
MTGTIIPLRLKRDETSALARFDATAADLLAEGRAPTLSAAQLDAILMKLRRQRAELLAINVTLETRASSGDARIDAINAKLCVEVRNGLAQIELLIHQSEAGALAARRGSRPA